MVDKEKAEKKRIYDKKYREKNEKKIKERKQKYREENAERLNEKQQKYRLTEAGRKCERINAWKKIGVISDNFDELYEYYFNCWECENCGVELIEGRYGNNKRCLDHCHKTGEFRNVLCHRCNLLRGE